MSAPESMLQLLPPPPAHVLLSGAGLESMVAELSAHGYELTKLNTSNDSDQIWFAASSAQGSSFDSIIFMDVPPNLDSLQLFTRSFDLLRAGGKLILPMSLFERLFDRVLKKEGIHAHGYLDVLASRYGFQISSGPESWVVFVKADSPRWRLSHAGEKDVPKLLELFRSCFGHEITPEFWQWKHGQGRGHGIAAWRGDVLAAYYGGTKRAIVFFGKPVLALVIGDVMVDATERALFTKKGAFLVICTTFAEVHGATYLTAFGFPNQRAMRVAERTGIYSEVDHMVSVHWNPMPDRPRLATRICYIPGDFPPRYRNIVDRLWADMKTDLQQAIVGVRDANYVLHRYLNHPHHRYDILVVTSRLMGVPLGVIVLRRHDGVCELSDIIAPLRNIPALIAQARRMARRFGLSELYAWITWHNAPLFTATGGVEKPMDIRIPTSTWIDVPLVEAQRDRWWLMSGDTDFL